MKIDQLNEHQYPDEHKEEVRVWMEKWFANMWMAETDEYAYDVHNDGTVTLVFDGAIWLQQVFKEKCPIKFREIKCELLRIVPSLLHILPDALNCDLSIEDDLDNHGDRSYSLHNIHELIHNMNNNVIFVSNSLNSSCLGLLKIKNLRRVRADVDSDPDTLAVKNAIDIINKYIQNGEQEEWQDCAHELKMAGLANYARF